MTRFNALGQMGLSQQPSAEPSHLFIKQAPLCLCNIRYQCQGRGGLLPIYSLCN